MNTIGSSLTAEELEFCISALQLNIEDIELALESGKHSKTELEHMSDYIKKLNKIQDEFLVPNNAFPNTDLVQVALLIKAERNYLNYVLDQPNTTGEMRAMAQHHLSTANSILRKFKKYFESFGITV